MNSNEALMIVLAAILIAAAIVVGFAAVDTATAPEIIHPAGLMTGEQIHPGGECAPKDRILLDNPIRIEDENGTVHWHWLYENRTIARNRT